MRYLFVHQNFPGQYLHTLRHLADSGHDLMFLSGPSDNDVPGVRKIEYQPIRASTPGIYYDAVEFESAMVRAESVAVMARKLANIGYKPDIILGHNGWGEILNLRDVWPETPLVPYFEFYYSDSGLDVDFDSEFPIAASLRPSIRAKNAINLLGLALADAGQTPTDFQRGTYPAAFQSLLRTVAEGVDLDVCRPNAKAQFILPGNSRRWRRTGRPLVTYVARNLEPYRGFHIMMRALPLLLAARRDVDVIVVGGDSVSYGAPPPCDTWRERMLDEVGDRRFEGRVFFPGRISYPDYVALLQVSAVHVYLTYPFVASWSLREALACGCVLVASDTAPVREFVRDGHNGRLVPFHDPGSLASAILNLLDDPACRADLSCAARAYAEEHFRLTLQHAAFDTLVAEVRR